MEPNWQNSHVRIPSQCARDILVFMMYVTEHSILLPSLELQYPNTYKGRRLDSPIITIGKAIYKGHVQSDGRPASNANGELNYLDSSYHFWTQRSPCIRGKGHPEQARIELSVGTPSDLGLYLHNQRQWINT